MSRLWRRENEDGIFILACPHPRCGPDPDEYPMSSSSVPTLSSSPHPTYPNGHCAHRDSLSQSFLRPPSSSSVSRFSVFSFSPWDDTLFVHGSPCSTHILVPTYLHTLFISFLSLGKSFSKFPSPLVFTSVVGESEEAA